MVKRIMPKISVIVPNYNHAKYLVQRIDSILTQTYQNFELIILDDCSTDNSREVIEQYRNNPKVSQIIYNTENSGSPFNQWNKGVKLAQGEYIWIAESDDWAEANFLEMLIPILDENPNVGIVNADSVVETESGSAGKMSEYFCKRYKDNRWQNDFIHNGKNEVREMLLYNCTIANVSSVLFRRDILMKANVFDMPFKYSGDWYCYLKIALISDIAFVATPLNHYRRHSANTTNSAGYAHLVEFMHIYNWLTKAIVIDKKQIKKGVINYMTDVYDGGLCWNPWKDVKILLPLNAKFYGIITWKLLKRKVRIYLKR